MKTKVLIGLLTGAFFFLPFSTPFAGEKYTDSLETEFVDGGQITIHLTAGVHEILPSPDNQIRVSWHLDRAYDDDDVDANTDISGSSAVIDLNGPRKNFRSLIEVPEQSDLIVRVSAGDLHVGNFEGDRDIKLRAGDLTIEVGETSDYGHVEGSLWAGDITAGPFDEEASGLFRSIEWDGSGKQDLKFKLMAGDVRIYQEAD